MSRLPSPGAALVNLPYDRKTNDTLSRDDVPEPPAGFHYELWFDFANQSEPENVAAVAVENGRVTYADVLVDSLASTVTGVQISLEPDGAANAAISDNVPFNGTVQPDAGLAEIELFPTNP